MSLYDSLQERLEDTHLYSGYFSSLCPFHSDTSPSFFVYEESDNKNYEFRCASCGKHGSLAYLDKYLGSHHTQTLTRSHSKPTVLPRWRKWEEKHGDLEGIAKFAHENLLRYKGYQTYFKKRGIDGYIDEGYLGYLDGWCTIPVFSRSHTLVELVVRSSGHKSGTRYVIGNSSHGDGNHYGVYCPDWKRLESSISVYVVYGIIDAISLHLAGLPVVTGITGKSLSAEILKPLGKRFIIVPDLGEEREAYNLANRLGWRARTQIIDYPTGTKDCDDIRREFGNTALLNLLGA